MEEEEQKYRLFVVHGDTGDERLLAMYDGTLEEAKECFEKRIKEHEDGTKVMKDLGEGYEIILADEDSDLYYFTHKWEECIPDPPGFSY